MPNPLNRMVGLAVEGLGETVNDGYAAFRARYRDDPVGFLRDCFTWPAGEGPVFYQEEVIEAVYEHRRYAVRAPRGGGKSATAAQLILHFALTNDGDTDWKILTTAGSWAQLIHYTWPEIHKWAGRLRWEVIGRRPFNRNRELLERTLHLVSGEAFAVAVDRPELIEGAHASRILLVFDEAKAVPDAIWDAAEGSLSTGDTYMLAISTPGETVGRFYQIHRGYFKEWRTRHVTMQEAVAAGRMLSEWVMSRQGAWERLRPDLWHNQVLAEFYTTSPDTLIPAHWLEKAFQRYERLELDGEVERMRDANVAYGVDVAEFGDDRTVITKLSSMIFQYQQVYAKLGIMETTGHTVAAVGSDKSRRVAVDANGVGAGVWSRLRELGYTGAIRVMVREKVNARDRHGVNTFASMRDYLYWLVREALDPENEPEFLLALPMVEGLVEELSIPKWSRRSNGDIEAEDKDEIKKRLGHSPDLFESLALAVLAARYKARGWNIA